MKLTLGDKEYFKGIGQIKYEGKRSDNPMAFKFYDAGKKVGKKNHGGALQVCHCLLAYVLWDGW